MDLTSVRTLASGLNLDAHGVPATVTPPAGTPVATRVIWVDPVRRHPTDEVYEPSPELLHRQADRRVLAVPRDAVSTVPLGTVVVAPERIGQPDLTWRVDGIHRVLAHQTRVIVVPVG